MSRFQNVQTFLMSIPNQSSEEHEEELKLTHQKSFAWHEKEISEVAT